MPASDYHIAFRRQGSHSWTLFGNSGTHPIDTLGPFPRDRYRNLGLEEEKCTNGKVPKKSESRFFQAFRHDFLEEGYRFSLENGQSWHFAPANRLNVDQVLTLASGRSCEDEIHAAAGRYAVSAISVIPRRKGRDIGIVVGNNSNAGQFVIQIFNHTNNVRLTSLVIDNDQTSYLILTKMFGREEVRPDLDEFRIEVFTSLSLETSGESTEASGSQSYFLMICDDSRRLT